MSFRTKWTIAAFGTGCIAGLALADWQQRRIHFATQVVVRSIRTACTVTSIGMHYQWHLCKERYFNSSTDWLRVHEFAAQKLLKLMQRNGGLYVKVGQHLSTLQYILPEEYCTTLSALHNRNIPESPFEDVLSMIASELQWKEDMEEEAQIWTIFESIDAHPIGCASLAQVHRGTLSSSWISSSIKDTNLRKHYMENPSVAIKVQHKRLADMVQVDLFTLKQLFRAIQICFPSIPNLMWICNEMQRNIPNELDFECEARNADRLRKFNLNLQIPIVCWPLTSKRLLVMEHIAGCHPTDMQTLQKWKIDPNMVIHTLMDAFARMIFEYGFVHCDPHPGNVIIMKNGRVALIDHGLYRSVPLDIRRAYGRLWYSLLSANEQEMALALRQVLNQKDPALQISPHRLISCLITQRSWQSISAMTLHQRPDKAEIALVRSRANAYIHHVLSLLSHLPPVVLMLLKTNDLLRNLQRILDPSDRSFLVAIDYMRWHSYDLIYSDRPLLLLYPIKRVCLFLDRIHLFLIQISALLFHKV